MKKQIHSREKLQKVLAIAFCWMLFAAFTFINEYFFILDLISLEKLSGDYDFWPDFTGTLILSAFGGFAGGYLLVYRMDSRYKTRSFAFGIINSGLLFVIFYLALAVVGLLVMGFLYFSFQTDLHSALQRAWNNLLVNLNAPSFFVSMCAWGILVSATQFMLQVNDKFGPGVLWKFITGKYYHPREEERIFMFLDLKSSTTIAEKLGHQLFFELLREIYRDVTEPIISSRGEIYQYVGDEVIVTWPVERGLRDNNCLLCFFRIEELMKEKKAYYLEKYGIVPSFKAGLHLGEATVGEIGVIKKDIVFSGDVLNTTSRIQGECNHHNVKILVSSDLLQRMPANGGYQKIPIGEIRLRGKVETVALSTVEVV